MVPIFFFGSTGSSDDSWASEGRYWKLRNFLVVALLALAFICTLVLLGVSLLDSDFLLFDAPPAFFLGSLLPNHNLLGWVSVLIVAVAVPILTAFAVRRRDSLIVTAVGVAVAAVWSTMAITAFLPVGV